MNKKILIPFILLLSVISMANGVNAWLDGNWEYRKNIIVNNSDSFDHWDEAIEMNVTELSLSTNNCSKEIRIGDSSDNEIPFKIFDDGGQGLGDGSEWCIIQFLTNITSSNEKTYYVYYGNSGASEPSYNIDFFYDSFTNSTLHPDWTWTEGGTGTCSNSLTTTDGWFEIHCTGSPNWWCAIDTAPKLELSISDSIFNISSYVNQTPVLGDNQGNGIYIKEDGDDFVSIGRRKEVADQEFEFAWDDSGSSNQAVPQPSNAQIPVMIKLWYNGTDTLGYNSTNGETWTGYNEFKKTKSMSNIEIGVYAKSWSGTNMYWSWDWFAKDCNSYTTSSSLTMGSEETCIPSWIIISNVTSCFNSTNLMNNVTWTDDNDCGESDYSNITYPILEYSFTLQVDGCFNSTTVEHVYWYNDTSSCGYSYNIINYTYCSEFYECSGGVCVYTGSCGDGFCQTTEGETQDNCCVDCGCPLYHRCENNVCKETIANVMVGAGQGTGSFLEVIREPLGNILIALGMVGGVAFLIYGISTLVSKSISGEKGVKKKY